MIGVGNLIFHPYGQSFLQAIASVYPGYHASPSVFDVVVGTLYGAVDGASGVLISGDNNTIRGLVISGFVTGIEITYSPDRTSSNNRLEQNYIGTDSSGTSAVANAGSGILIRGFGSPCCQAADNVVEENLISGNRQNGLLLCDAARTLIAGNLIGTDITGLADLGNGGSGIATICAGSPSNHMEANTVAYNGLDGFLVNIR